MEEKNTPDFIYLATTDYAMHKFGPEDEQALWHLSRLDQPLGEALGKVNGEMSIAVTADHGMNAKSHAVDLGKVLARADISAEAIPIIKVGTLDTPQVPIELRSHGSLHERTVPLVFL